MLPGTFTDKVIPDIDFTDEAVVQCDVPVVKILLQVLVIYKRSQNFDVNTYGGFMYCFWTQFYAQFQFLKKLKHSISIASRRNLGTTFSAGVWSIFLNTSKILLIYIILHTSFWPIPFSCIRCAFVQNTRKLIVYLRNLSENVFFFLLNLWGNFFGTHNV